jgi:hypothetical protein
MGSFSRGLLLLVIVVALAAIPSAAQPPGSGSGGAVSAAAASGQQPPDLHRWRLTRHGFGRLTVGLNRAQMERRTGRKLKFSYSTGSCAIWDVRGARGISIMTTRGRLARVGIYRGTWRAITGIRIGDTEAEVRERYPQLRTRPHPYDPDGQYLIVPGPNRRVVFETDGNDEVTSFRGGRMPEIMYIEGCA